MQKSSTVSVIVEMSRKDISYDDCRRRYGVGNSTVTLITERYKACGIPLESLQSQSTSKVEAISIRPKMSAESPRTLCLTLRQLTRGF